MVKLRGPTKEELQALETSVMQFKDEPTRDNYKFHALFNYENGLVAREVPTYKKGPDGRLLKSIGADGRVHVEQVGVRLLPIRRRMWIERYCRIRDKSGELVPLILSAPQRRLEVLIIRMQRAKVPVRIIVLKARQMGFSTYIEATGFDRVIRSKRAKALVVAHDDETATEVLQMAHTMRDELPRKQGQWTFKMLNAAAYHLAWGKPIHGHIKIASAKKKNPGRGFTMSFLHLSEAAFWDEASRKAKSLMNSLPKLPTSMCFMESTANGDVGYFRDQFWKAWDEKDVPLLGARRTDWLAAFFAWFEHPEYYWTKTSGVGRSLPDELALDIINTLTEEEEWLLQQTFFRRWTPMDPWEQVRTSDGAGVKWRRVGPGPCRVSLDQLAWRRLQIRDEHGGDPLKPDTWDEFQEEYPATPEQAFKATGRLVFSSDVIKRKIAQALEPIWVGELVDLNVEPADVVPDGGEYELVEKRRNVDEEDAYG